MAEGVFDTVVFESFWNINGAEKNIDASSIYYCEVTLFFNPKFQQMIVSETVLTYFTDSKNPVAQRIIVMIFLLTIVFWVNDVMKFTFYYRLQKKVEALDDLTRIMNNPAMDSVGRKEAAALRKELLNEVPQYTVFYGFLLKKLNGGFSKSTNRKMASPRETKNTMNNHSRMFTMLEYLKLMLSTSGIFFLGGMIIIAGVIMKSEDSIIDTLAFATVLFVLLMFVVLLVHLFIILLPPPGSDVGNLYVFNVLIQFLLFTSIVTILIFLKNRLR